MQNNGNKTEKLKETEWSRTKTTYFNMQKRVEKWAQNVCSVVNML
jgi:hypothetical protein